MYLGKFCDKGVVGKVRGCLRASTSLSVTDPYLCSFQKGRDLGGPMVAGASLLPAIEKGPRVTPEKGRADAERSPEAYSGEVVEDTEAGDGVRGPSEVDRSKADVSSGVERAILEGLDRFET